MDSTIKKVDVKWNKDGRSVNWNGRDWPLKKCGNHWTLQHTHGGGGCGDGRDSRGGCGAGRGAVGGITKSITGYQSRNKNTNNKKKGADGGNRGGYTNYKRRSEEEQKQYDEGLANRSCFGCHQSGHIRNNCPNKVQHELKGCAGDGDATVSAQKQEDHDAPRAPIPSMTAVKPNQEPVYNPKQWVFNNGANRYLVGGKRYFVSYHEHTPEEREKATVYGYNGENSPVGHGPIDLWVSVDGESVVLRVENVHYSTNLFSQSVATEQGFQIAYDNTIRTYTLSINGTVALKIDIQPFVGGGSTNADTGEDNDCDLTHPRTGAPAIGASPQWLQRPLRSFNHDVVLHPHITRKQNGRDHTQGSTIGGNTHRLAHVESENPTLDREYGDEHRGSLVEVPDPDDEEISLHEMQVYAAFPAIVLITKESKPQQRVWHLLKVRTLRTVPQAMNSPQRAEWWKGIQKEVVAMIEKDVLELVLESEMPPGPKPLETMWSYQPKTDGFGNSLRFRSRLWDRGDKAIPGVDLMRLPMDTTVKLRAAKEGDKEPSLFYRGAIVARLYLATSTRPGLAFPVRYLSRFVQHPNMAHAGGLKQVLRYLAATKTHGVFFKQQGSRADQILKIDSFVDADWRNCPDTRKRVTCYVMMIAGGPVSWAARRQNVVALSTAEAEYAATCEACQEGQAINNILMELRGHVRFHTSLVLIAKQQLHSLRTPLTAEKPDTLSYAYTTCAKWLSKIT
ncbi:unnamed protein product [Phytophthora fragariaefolia]|uniref:Unnamed protein product n=1 Tax=Phytophthora fragariaefolia TaxID=1490495 RepID=A0A9W7D780_9STRA|nr:unnamed protein product [Phytophthora fragariaefolia]